MANYYFLITAFEPLEFGVRPELSLKELIDYLEMNLTAEDQKLLQILWRPVDLYNIRAFWLGKPLKEMGRFKAKELEEELLVQGDLPEYLIEFLQKYDSVRDRLRYFSSNYVAMYKDEGLRGFLRKYFDFERNLRLVLLALRSIDSGRDVVYQLQFEDPHDPLVADILAQKEAKEYSPPSEYEEIKTLFMNYRSDALDLNFAIEEYRFKKIEEMEVSQDFGIDRILAYVAKYMIIESVTAKDLEKGKEILSHYE